MPSNENLYRISSLKKYFILIFIVITFWFLVLIIDKLLSIKNDKFYDYEDLDHDMKLDESVKSFITKSDQAQSDWQDVSGLNYKYFVYSAYFDTRSGEIVAIGASKSDKISGLFCQVFDDKNVSKKVLGGTISILNQISVINYTVILITCSFEKPTMTSPHHLSLISRSKEPVSNLLPIQVPTEKFKQNKRSLTSFSVCVKPIHSNYNKAKEFIEWMEFHQLMGVHHFTFFNNSIGENVTCLLKEYEKLDKIQIDILPWHFPVNDIYGGAIAAINDCIFRHRGVSKYLIIVDLDEMIVPRNGNKNYLQMIRNINKLYPDQTDIGAYVFQSSFYYVEKPSDISLLNRIHNQKNPNILNIINHLTMTTKTKRGLIYPYGQNSKYIVMPGKIKQAGIFPWKLVQNSSYVNVSTQFGLIHHYRDCNTFFAPRECLQTTVLDRATHNYGEKLAIKVDNILKELSKYCKLDKIFS